MQRVHATRRCSCSDQNISFEMEYEKCYVFEPGLEPLSKRRRVELRGLQSSWELRREAYREAWQRQKEKIDVFHDLPLQRHNANGK